MTPDIHGDDGPLPRRAARWLWWLAGALSAPLLALWQLLRLRVHQVRLAAMMPGPRALPLFGIALGPKSLKPQDIFSYSIAVAMKYGKTFRFYLGPLLFVQTQDPRDLEVILSGINYIEKGFMYKFVQPWLNTGLLTSNGEKWRTRRKMLTPAFHFKILDQFVPVFHSCGDVFVDQLRKRAGAGAFDVGPLVQLLTLDIICETAMGVKINAQADSMSKYVQALKVVESITVARIFQPWYIPDFIFLNSPVGRRFRNSLKILHATTEKVIREKQAELDLMNDGNQKLDVDELRRRRRVAFLDMLLLMARDGGLSDLDIREEVDTFMFAGHDTTACAISFAMFLLSRHADVQDRVFEELISVFDVHEPFTPSIQQLSELKYLEMVIKESLRLYPPASNMNRSNPQDTHLANGLVMPRGCSISIVPFLIHRQEDVFPDAERFDPERFSPEESARRHPFAYLPFSAGPRNCIGQRFAMLELKSVLAKVVWNFRVLPEPGFEPVVSWELTLKSVNGLLVRLEERRKKEV